MIQKLSVSQILLESTVAELFSYYTEIRKNYTICEADIVSSHNDLNPGNILFDGRKIWVIDWDAAFQNDRYVDLAIAANSFVTNELQETIFLTAYFGTPPNEQMRARLFLMKQLCFMLYAMLMFKLAMEKKPCGTMQDFNIHTPNLKEISKRLGNGSLLLSSNDGKYLYAAALLNEALSNMRSPRFAAAIKLIAYIPAI